VRSACADSNATPGSEAIRTLLKDGIDISAPPDKHTKLATTSTTHNARLLFSSMLPEHHGCALATWSRRSLNIAICAGAALFGPSGSCKDIPFKIHTFNAVSDGTFQAAIASVHLPPWR
jgi:hypothetical protein